MQCSLESGKKMRTVGCPALRPGPLHVTEVSTHLVPKRTRYGCLLPAQSGKLVWFHRNRMQQRPCLTSDLSSCPTLLRISFPPFFKPHLPKTTSHLLHSPTPVPFPSWHFTLFSLQLTLQTNPPVFLSPSWADSKSNPSGGLPRGQWPTAASLVKHILQRFPAGKLLLQLEPTFLKISRAQKDRSRFPYLS